jgi:hypothetical protein
MKKLIYIICLFLLHSGVLSAQSNESPKISTGKLKWSKEIKVPPLFAFETQTFNFPPDGLAIYYLYQASFKDEGDKKIKGLVWDYIFEDVETKQELNRYQFYSPNKINKNESVTIQRSLVSPPTRIVNAKSLEKDNRSPYFERLEIKCVIYADNSS